MIDGLSVGVIVMLALACLCVPIFFAGIVIWFTGSWEVVEDDQLDAPIGRGAINAHALVALSNRMFRPAVRQLGYRRDKRGRFRRMWRW
jgi:hypothetical protein